MFRNKKEDTFAGNWDDPAVKSESADVDVDADGPGGFHLDFGDPSPASGSMNNVGGGSVGYTFGVDNFSNSNSASGFGGFGVGAKMVTIGKPVVVRHRPVLRGVEIGKPALLRLCRRAGVKRCSGLLYDELRGIIRSYLDDIIRNAIIFTELRRKKYISPQDVVRSLKCRQTIVYGFGGLS